MCIFLSILWTDNFNLAQTRYCRCSSSFAISASRIWRILYVIALCRTSHNVWIWRIYLYLYYIMITRIYSIKYCNPLALMTIAVNGYLPSVRVYIVHTYMLSWMVESFSRLFYIILPHYFFSSLFLSLPFLCSPPQLFYMLRGWFLFWTQPNLFNTLLASGSEPIITHNGKADGKGNSHSISI